jgi:hypothetical protein
VKCFYCGNEHETKCPLISAYDYTPDGKVCRIEFVTFADIQLPQTIFDLMPEGTTKQ